MVSNKMFLKNTFWLGFFTIISRILGYARERLIAYYLGVSVITDAISISLKLPSFFRRTLAEGAFSSSFLPVFSKIPEDQKKSFFITSLTILITILIPLLILSIFWTCEVVCFLLPKIKNFPEKLNYVVSFSKVTFPFIVFICIASLLSCVLQSYQKFKLAAAVPFLGNLTIIICSIFFIKIGFFTSEAKAIVVSSLLCGFVQMIVLVLPVLKILKKGSYKINFKTKNVQDFFKKFLPGALGSAGTQINILIETSFISILSVGGASYIAYADRTIHLLVGVVSVSISTTLLPALASAIKTEEKKMLLSTAIHLCFLISIPALIGCVFFGKTIIKLLYNYGAFKQEFIEPTSKALLGLSIGLPSFFVVKVFSSACFANGDTKTPATATLFSIFTCVAFSLVLVKSHGFLGLTLATSLASYVNSIFLFFSLTKKGFLTKKMLLGIGIHRIFFSNALFFAIMKLKKDWFFSFINLFSNRMLQTFALIGLSLILYFICCALCGLTKYWFSFFKRQ